MFYVYILQSEKTHKFYIGSTENLEDRFQRHNNGRSKATASGIPWKIKYKEEFTTRTLAVSREMQIKGWKSHKRIEQLISS